MPSSVRFSTVKLVILRIYSSNVCDFSFMVRFLANMVRDTVSFTGVVSFNQVSFRGAWVLFRYTPASLYSASSICSSIGTLLIGKGRWRVTNPFYEMEVILGRHRS
jgi:hypothetical protein